MGNGRAVSSSKYRYMDYRAAIVVVASNANHTVCRYVYIGDLNMFFGFNETPKFLERFKDVKIKRERKRVCSRNKGTCRGSWVRKQPDGTTKWQFAYFDMPENHTYEEYLEMCKSDQVIFDDGIWQIKCTVEIGGNTYCWYEEESKGIDPCAIID
jgi:hypothetical protein